MDPGPTEAEFRIPRSPARRPELTLGLVEEHEPFALLVSIKGIGEELAVALLSDLGDPGPFDNGRQSISQGDNTKSLAGFYCDVLEQAAPDQAEGFDEASAVYTLDWTGYGELDKFTPRIRPRRLASFPLVPSIFRMMRRLRNRVVKLLES